MVIGLDKFREQFAGEEDKYIIIGGTACDVNLRDTNTEPRDTPRPTTLTQEQNHINVC